MDIVDSATETKEVQIKPITRINGTIGLNSRLLILALLTRFDDKIFEELDGVFSYHRNIVLGHFNCSNLEEVEKLIKSREVTKCSNWEEIQKQFVNYSFDSKESGLLFINDFIDKGLEFFDTPALRELASLAGFDYSVYTLYKEELLSNLRIYVRGQLDSVVKTLNMFIPVDDGSRPVLRIKVKYHFEDMPQLTFIGGTEKSDWIDVTAQEITVGGLPCTKYKQGDCVRVDLGFSMEMPEGYEAHLLPRSSTFDKYGLILTNSMGIIDNSYKGENDHWLMSFVAMRDGELPLGERIGQFRLEKRMSESNRIIIKQVSHLTGEDRGGFGSTGK